MKNLLHTLALFIIKWHKSPIKNESTAEISLQALFNFTLNIYCCHGRRLENFKRAMQFIANIWLKKQHLRRKKNESGRIRKGYIESDKCGFHKKSRLLFASPKKNWENCFSLQFPHHRRHCDVVKMINSVTFYAHQIYILSSSIRWNYAW